MKAFFGLISFSLLLVYFFGSPFALSPNERSLRISDLTAIEEIGLSPAEMSKVFVASSASTYPNTVTSGNSPNMYMSGNNPNTVTAGNMPNAMTRGNFPDRYTLGGFSGNLNGATFPMPKVNF